MSAARGCDPHSVAPNQPPCPELVSKGELAAYCLLPALSTPGTLQVTATC